MNYEYGILVVILVIPITIGSIQNLFSRQTPSYYDSGVFPIITSGVPRMTKIIAPEL